MFLEFLGVFSAKYSFGLTIPNFSRSAKFGYAIIYIGKFNIPIGKKIESRVSSLIIAKKKY